MSLPITAPIAPGPPEPAEHPSAAANGRRRRVFVCHPFAADRAVNAGSVRAICRSLALGGELPIAPHLYLPEFLDEGIERPLALELCAELLAACDEVRVYGPMLTSGMRRELAHARALGIPVHFIGAGS